MASLAEVGGVELGVCIAIWTGRGWRGEEALERGVWGRAEEVCVGVGHVELRGKMRADVQERRNSMLLTHVRCVPWYLCCHEPFLENVSLGSSEEEKWSLTRLRVKTSASRDTEAVEIFRIMIVFRGEYTCQPRFYGLANLPR